MRKLKKGYIDLGNNKRLRKSRDKSPGPAGPPSLLKRAGVKNRSLCPL